MGAVGSDRQRPGAPHDIGLEHHQAECEHDREPAHHDAGEFVLHGVRMQEAIDHRQHQAARRGGDESGLGHAGQRLGLAMAEAVPLVGRNQRLANGEESDQRAHQVECTVDQRRQHRHRVGDQPGCALGRHQDDRDRDRGHAGQSHQPAGLLEAGSYG